MILGIVVSFIYAVCYKLWRPKPPAKLSVIQFYTQQIGTLGMLISLFLLFDGLVAESILGPILGISTLAVFISMVLMKNMFIKSNTK
jgi:hypothetical protein